MSYRPGLPPALKNLNLDVGRNEKVGIVGRTGTYFRCEFRLALLIRKLCLQVLVNPPFSQLCIDWSKLHLERLRLTVVSTSLGIYRTLR